MVHVHLASGRGCRVQGEYAEEVRLQAQRLLGAPWTAPKWSILLFLECLFHVSAMCLQPS